MRPVLRVGVLLILSFVALAACAAPTTSAPAPTAWQAVKAAPGDRVELTSDQYQLLMFYAPQWGTCREVAPIVNGLMKNYTDRVRFVRLNIHDQATFELQAQLGVSTTPEFYLIDPQGHVERRWDESVDLDELEETIQALPPYKD